MTMKRSSPEEEDAQESDLEQSQEMIMDDEILIKNLCSKCGKVNKQECSQQSCLKCCTDMDCTVHNTLRAQAKEKTAILNGTHPINIQANEKRFKLIKPGAFAESSFKYIGDSAILFSLRDYFSDAKGKDAVRKSKHRRHTNTAILSKQSSVVMD